MLEFYRNLVDDLGEWRWALWAVVGLAGIALGTWLLDQIWKRALVPLTKRTRTSLDRLIVQSIRRPALALAFAGSAKLLFSWIVHQAQFKAAAALAERAGEEGTELVGHWTRGFAITLTNGALYVAVTLAACALGYALVTAVCDWYLLNVASKTSTTLDNEFVPVFRRMAKVVVLFVGVTVILGHFDVPITSLLGAAGFASLAVALAAQETVANMISGFTILVDRPFRLGDRVELADGTVGDVTEVGLRSTKILSFDSTQLIIPNKQISTARIINHSYPDTKVKIRKDYTVAYGSDLDKVKATLVEIARGHPKVLAEPPPAVYFTDFGDSALVFKLICWVGDYKEKFAATDEINMEVSRRFAQENIEIPFPQRDIHVRSGGLAAS